jgi:hypothetical protein
VRATCGRNILCGLSRMGAITTTRLLQQKLPGQDPPTLTRADGLDRATRT